MNSPISRDILPTLTSGTARASQLDRSLGAFYPETMPNPSISGWLLQSQQFYNNALANPETLTLLAEYGITEPKLKACLAETEAVTQANLVQEKEKGEAQNATKIRDKAIDELNDWLNNFIPLARIALEAEPQLLESLGILERS